MTYMNQGGSWDERMTFEEFVEAYYPDYELLSEEEATVLE